MVFGKQLDLVNTLEWLKLKMLSNFFIIRKIKEKWEF